MLGFAVVAVSVSASAGTLFVFGYIASSATLIVGVMYLLICWFLGFVNGVIRTDFSHLILPPVIGLYDFLGINFPRGTQKPLVPQDVFGGITDCEGGGG